MSITLRVPAKVNPQLRAGPLREDGYHDITMVYQAISLYDTLRITHNPDGPTVRVLGTDSDRVPVDERNIVIKAARLLGGRVGVEPRLHFELEKQIPAEAGLGGGSADAAAALVGCNSLWKAGLSDEELMEIGAHVGEDVPFFIKGMMALNLGHKQPLTTLEMTNGRTWHWVLGIPHAGLATKEVFRKYDELLAANSSNEEDYLCRRQGCIDVPWGTSPPQDLLPQLENDLEYPSTQLLPDIAVALQAGRDSGAVKSLMSGSGSTCAFLTADESHARSLMGSLQSRSIFRRVIMVSGPVEGVKIVENNQ
ncbi:4-diphosphocytidyl-2-C-methyl-D-erythritol kinase [Aspergillus karnatakaensis]|uniref:4-diphosphocytidyl-2-C-methyl-D-erythritol kinase n=1 Tax=Aspergillus karnatakaensis TaxID=1810916 RepID=UPI003CCCB00F